MRIVGRFLSEALVSSSYLSISMNLLQLKEGVYDFDYLIRYLFSVGAAS